MSGTLRTSGTAKRMKPEKPKSAVNVLIKQKREIIAMAWNTRGLRGNTLELMINLTNDFYRSKGLALIQKVPTPITPAKFDSETRRITSAYFSERSTIDYIGAVQGIPVCFDAKETSQKNLPIQNIHQHQIDFMRDFQKQRGVAFLLVYFSLYNEYFFLSLDDLWEFWTKSESGGRRSIPYEEFDKELKIPITNGTYLHYLEALNVYLQKKDS